MEASLSLQAVQADALALKNTAETAMQTDAIGFLLVDQFPMMSLTAAIEPLRAANRLLGYEAYAWHYLGAEAGTVQASNGMAIPAATGVAAPPPVSLVFVCAGLEIEAAGQPRISAGLRRMHRAGTRLGAISGGSFVLARAGLLDGYRCAIHWEQRPAFLEAFPHIDCTDSIFEIDRDRLTCAGGVASMEMMLKLIGDIHGADLAAYVANQFQLERIRPAREPQRSSRLRPSTMCTALVNESIALMRNNIEDPLSTQSIAERLRISVRQLERSFQRDLGNTPGRFYQRLRLERARELLLYTHMRILDAAVASGFRSSSYFAQCFRSEFGVTPSAVQRGRKQSMTNSFSDPRRAGRGAEPGSAGAAPGPEVRT